MLEYGTLYPIAQMIAVLAGYAIATFAFFIYVRNNIQPMVYFGLALVFLATTFFLPNTPSHWASPSTILTINYVLLFSSYSLIGYGIVLVRDQ